AVVGASPLGFEGTGGSVDDSPTGACGKRRLRPHGSKQEYLRLGTASSEQRPHHLPRCRTRSGVPVPRGLRAQGARVPRAVAPEVGPEKPLTGKTIAQRRFSGPTCPCQSALARMESIAPHDRPPRALTSSAIPRRPGRFT